MGRRLCLYMLICLIVLGSVGHSYAEIGFRIDRVEYDSGIASIYGSVSSDVYGELAETEIDFDVFGDGGASVDVTPDSRVTGAEPTSVSEGVYSYSLDPVSFTPTADTVSYTVYASVSGTTVGTDMVVPGTSNTLVSLSIDGEDGSVSQDTNSVVVHPPEETPAGEYPVEFAHNGSYLKMNGAIVTSGSPFSFTDSDPGDSDWDSVTVAVYGQNNAENIYVLDIIPGGSGGESSIDSWRFVRPSDNSGLQYGDNYYLFYKGIPGKEVIKVRVQLKEGTSPAITGELRLFDRRNPEQPIGDKYADCVVQKESDTVYYLSVDLAGIDAIPDHSESSSGLSQFAICILEDGGLVQGGPREPVAVINPNPRRASFLNLEGSETTDWATDIVNYGNTDVPLVFHTVGKGKITFNTGLDLTESETIGNLKDIGPLMMESYGRIELDALEGSAFQNGATLEMYGLPFVEMPDIIDDSDVHDVIGAATYSGGTLTFQVNGFTTYIAQPRLSVNDLAASTTNSTATINGIITDPQATVTITVGGLDQGAVLVDPTTGAFSKTVNLAVGSNTISIDASHTGFGYDLTPVVKNVRRMSSGGGGGTGGGISDTTTESGIEVDSDGRVTIETGEPSVDSSGAATVELSANALKDAIEKAIPGADGVKNIQIVIPFADSATSYKPQIPAAFVTAETDDETVSETIEIKTETADLTIPSNMLNSDLAARAENVAISIARADASDLDPELAARIGGKPVIELNMEVDGKTVVWSNPNAPVTVSVLYTPTAEEMADPEHIVVWYIDGNGSIVAVPTGRYDPTTGRVVFQVTHFSKYAVAYLKKSFDDVGSCPWAQKQIEVMASKGIINGTSDTTYSPAADVRRADFVVLLVKALGLSRKANGNFSDVTPSAYYYEEVGIARELGITSGLDGHTFDPLRPVTRQDMMTLIARAMVAAGKNLIPGLDVELDSFLDGSLVAPYAVDSVATLIKNGIVVGSDNLLNPSGNATRAEAAVIIYRVYNKNSAH